MKQWRQLSFIKIIQEHRSGNKSVVLRDVQRELTAYYKCEVSGDQPTFHTEVKSALMLVVGELNPKRIAVYRS